RERVSAAKADDPLTRVCIVVPTNYVGVSARRLLARGELGPVTERGDGVAGLTLLTVYRLAELLGAPRLAAAGRRPVSTPVLAGAVRRVLAQDPGVFGPVRDHPSTEEELVRVHRELSDVTPASLDRLAATSRRARDVVRIHRAIRSLVTHDWYEEADLLTAARDAIHAGAPVARDLGTVIVYLPQALSIPAAALLRAVATVNPVEVIAARTGAAKADEDLERTLRRLALDPAASTDTAHITAPKATSVVSVSDADEEVGSAVQRVIDAARAGVPLERMAILYPHPEPYARIVHDQLQAAGIGYNGRAVRPLTDRLLGRWLLDLLELPEQRFSRPAVTGLFAGAPVRTSDTGSTHGRGWVPAGPWERITRDAGIVHDRAEWLQRLTRYANQQRATADQEQQSEDPREWLVERLRSNADHADNLRAFVTELCDHLARASRLTTWRALVDWSKDMIRRYLGGEPRRERWPEAEREAADRVDAALDRLAGLGAVEPHTDLEVFRRALRLELKQDLGKVGEFGAGVLVGTTSAGLGIDLDLVVVLGLAEGVCPTRPRADSLLSDAERRVVADELKPRADLVHQEHRHFLAALAASRGERVVVFPRGDLRRSVERPPSRWLIDTVEALRDDDVEGPRSLPASASWFTKVPSFAGRVRSVRFPATRQHYALRALMNDNAYARRLLRHPLATADAALAAGAQLVLGRRADGFTRFDGNLADLAAQPPSPAAPDEVVSASQLEAYLACPHAYLMRHVLAVQPVDTPEELLEMEPTEKGSLVHAILERWLCQVLERGVPAATQVWPDEARQRLREIAEAACRDAEERGVSGHPILWRRDRQRLLLDFTRFVDHDDERRRTLRATPIAAELSFGAPGLAGGPVVIDLGDGRTVRVRGRIDRVDRSADGTVVVADYKTGSIRTYADLTQDRPLGDGTKLQLPIYGLAIRQANADAQSVRTEYWFVSTKGEFKRIGYALTDEVVEDLRHALRVIADGIDAGRFPLRPEKPGWRRYVACPYCDPDELGTADRYRDWERLRTLPELRDYVALVEPDALEQEVR
ncbi:MAG: PD-(D/E)XK nuclease family protein, partial [Actinomycetota bacterium]|nr:PD-(D/E)XK nuclease family protein [Actinomycetota bacterium]